MTISYTVFKPKFKKAIADAIYNEVISQTGTYYHWFGKENTWTDFLNPFIPSSQGDYPGQPSENYRYELHVRRDILTAKKIKTSDVSYVVPRYDWTYNTVYDMYDDAYETSEAIIATHAGATGPLGASGATGISVLGYYEATRLEDAKYYVLTIASNVYKCIDNNNNARSTVEPTGTSVDIITTSDGYKWKFLYTIPVSLRNRFLSSTYMPVTTSLKSQFFSNGELNRIIIENGGKDYNPNTTIAIIDGDGYQGANPYVISGLTKTSGGKGYSSITITVIPPFENYTEWSALLDVDVGTYIKYTNPATTFDNFYQVMTGTKLGEDGPIHLSGTVSNGAAQLKYVGQTATASATLISGSIDVLSLNTSGYGYQGIPAATAVASPPVTKDADWAANTSYTLNQKVKYGINYYTVTTAGTSNTTPPTHTTGVVTNGATYTFLASDAVITVVQTKTDALVDLIITPGIDSVYTTIINDSGTKYVEEPSVTIAAPVSGVQAEANASIANGKVTIINLTEAGSGYTSAPSITIGAPRITFNAVSDVDGTLHTITYNNHRFVTGDPVVYSHGGGTNIGTITSGNTYYIIKVDGNTLKLASSASNALAGQFYALTDGVGSSHTLTLAGGIATAIAVLGTGGEIVGYSIVDGGVGYTNANITINDSSQTEAWNNTNAGGAILTPDFNSGNINTLQANVELLAVPGTIEAMKVVNGGEGYGAATCTILGDGYGATADVICSGNKVTGFTITNPGRGYTWSDIQINGNEGSSGATARAIMAPLGGHGNNAIDELNASTLVFYTSISRDKNQGIEINNDYRKVGLIRNLKRFGQNTKFTDEIGSGCVLITANFDKALIQYDMLLVRDGYKKYRVVDFNDTQILLSVFNDFSVTVGDILVTDPTDDGTQVGTVPSSNIVITDFQERTIDQFSGDLLMLTVREPYSPTAEQIITVRTVLTI